MECHYWTAIDVGVINMAIVKGEIDIETLTIKKIIDVQKIDLMTLPHEKVSREECTLHHSNGFFDRLSHLKQEFAYLFDDSEKILIERQPPGFGVTIEQILMSFWRQKTVLISPNSMHAYFHLSNDYDMRKIQTVQIATPHLKNFEAWKENSDRLHDISDAFCILVFGLHKERQRLEDMEKKLQQDQETLERARKFDAMRIQFENKTISVDDFLEKFKFKAPENIK